MRVMVCPGNKKALKREPQGLGPMLSAVCGGPRTLALAHDNDPDGAHSLRRGNDDRQVAGNGGHGSVPGGDRALW